MKGNKQAEEVETIRKIAAPLSRRRVLVGATGVALAAATRAPAAPAALGPRMLRATASGYDGSVPGPSLQVRCGEEVWVRLRNDLSEPTAIHWHGVRAPNAMDGAPPLTQAAIAPGGEFDYRFVAPDAGTYWYHPPRQGRGLFGGLIVAEQDPPDIDRDQTLIFGAAGAAAPLTINGAAIFDVAAGANERLRLRLINAQKTNTDAGDMLALRVDGLRAFVMAIDGEPAQPFAARDGRLMLGPGNRIDLFVDCTLPPGAAAAIMIERQDGAVPLVRIMCDPATAGRKTPRPDPQALPPNPLPERMDFRGALRFDAAVGLVPARSGSPLFTVKRGRTVMLGLSNETSDTRSTHLHGHHFRLLDTLDDGWKPFWLDTLPLAPRSEARIAFVADNPGKWSIEGLTAANDADAWFEVD